MASKALHHHYLDPPVHHRSALRTRGPIKRPRELRVIEPSREQGGVEHHRRHAGRDRCGATCSRARRQTERLREKILG